MILNLNEEIVSKNIETKIEKKDKNIKKDKNPLEKINIEIKEKISEKQKNKIKSKNKVNKGSKFFSYLIVFVISFVALIILLDTLKTPLINVFPSIEIILFSLYETLQDIKLFIIDLI